LNPEHTLLGFVDLRGTIDRVIDTFPDGREAALERGFHPSNPVVDGVVGVME